MTIFPGSGFGLDLDPEIPSESMHSQHTKQREHNERKRSTKKVFPITRKTRNYDPLKISRFCLFIYSIPIIRLYFAECVIVLISDYCGQLQFLIFFIFCVVSSHQ